MLFGLSVVLAGVAYAQGSQSARLQSWGVVPKMQMQVFGKLQRLSLGFYEREGRAAVVSRVTSDVEATRTFLDGVVIQGSVIVLSLLALMMCMLRVHVGLTVASLGTTPILALLTRRFSKWVRVSHCNARDIVDDLVRTVSEGIRAMQATKLWGREQEELKRFAGKNRSVGERQRALLLQGKSFAAAVGFTSQLGVAVLLGYGGLLVLRRDLSFGQLVAFAGLLAHFAGQISALAQVVSSLEQSVAGARRVFEVLDAPVHIQNPSGTSVLSAEAARRLNGCLRFEHVAFQYPNGNIALSDVTFEVQAGACVGILGATGAGKTTLLNLVPRLYDVSKGRISIDGHDVRSLGVPVLRGMIGAVFQKNALFRQSVADNISLGVPDASRAEIEWAARTAGAHEFIQRIPGGYDGMLTEGGANLSGGQQQRLALARAVLVKPRIMLLDDPTNALDCVTEGEVLVGMRRAIRDCTTLLVANRIPALRLATYIVVLEGGRVVEQGTPELLLEARGRYYQLWCLHRLVGERFGD